MTFSFPAAFYLLIPIIAAIAWTLRTRASRAPRSIIAALLRLCAFTALLTAVAGPYMQRELPAESLTAFLDLSSSITPPQGETLLERARRLAASLNVPLKVVPFAKHIAPASVQVGALERYTSLRQNWEKLNPGATNLAQLASFPTQSSVALLLSDGYKAVLPNSFSDKPLKSLKVNHLYCGNFK